MIGAMNRRGCAEDRHRAGAAAAPPGPVVNIHTHRHRAPGYSDTQVNNPYGLVIGPGRRALLLRSRQPADPAARSADAAHDHDRRQRPARLRRRRRPGGRGGAQHAARDPVRRARQPLHRRARQPRRAEGRRADRRSSRRSPAPARPDSPATADRPRSAQLRQPHSIAVDRRRRLLICDIGNQRIRRVDLGDRRHRDLRRHGRGAADAGRRAVAGTPLNGPRTMAFDAGRRSYLALREGNAIYRIDAGRPTLHHVAGTGEQGYSGDGGPARDGELGRPEGTGLVARTRPLRRRHRESRHSPNRSEAASSHRARHGAARRRAGARPLAASCRGRTGSAAWKRSTSRTARRTAFGC